MNNYPAPMVKSTQQCPCEQVINSPKCAHAYVPFQYLVNVYPPMKALHRATMFPELDRPYGVDPEYTVDA